MERIQNFIGGEWVGPISKKYLPNYEPATGKVYSELPDSDEQDVDRAVQAAERAYPDWSRTNTEDRSKVLSVLSRLIERESESLAKAEVIDNGKPISEARSNDLPRAARNFAFFSSAILHWASESYASDRQALHYVLRQPIGVAGCISPWNLPLYLFTWKIAPALATGNCVVAKPSEITPMTAHLLSKLAMEAGLPPGVLNIVHGLGAKVGNAISLHPRIPMLSFTGGTETGIAISRAAATHLKRVSLELGGKNPNIVFADCDFNVMLETTLRSSFGNQGQICLAGSRILIERSIYEKFREEFVARAKKRRLGDPLESTTEQGAVISEPHLTKILSYVLLAKSEGGKILCGGDRTKVNGRCAEGWFVSPTVIEGCAPDCRTNQEEIFGPVVTLIPFEREEEALTIANGTRFGLGSTVWTQNVKRAHRFASELQAGIVWVNCWMVRDLRAPFGGAKQSGIGREGGVEALRFFTEAKNVCVKM